MPDSRDSQGKAGEGIRDPIGLQKGNLSLFFFFVSQIPLKLKEVNFRKTFKFSSRRFSSFLTSERSTIHKIVDFLI